MKKELTTNIRDFRDNLSNYLTKLKYGDSLDYIKLTRDGEDMAVIFPSPVKTNNSKLAYKRLKHLRELAKTL